MFTPIELKNLLVLLEKTQITGKEAFTLASLQLKIADLVKKEETKLVEMKEGEMPAEGPTTE